LPINPVDGLGAAGFVDGAGTAFGMGAAFSIAAFFSIDRDGMSTPTTASPTPKYPTSSGHASFNAFSGSGER
jgi:hypothetical protein